MIRWTQRRSIIMENHCGNRNPNRYNVVICINKQDEAILPPYTLLLVGWVGMVEVFQQLHLVLVVEDGL